VVALGAVTLVLHLRNMREGWVSIRGRSLGVERKEHPVLFRIVATLCVGSSLYLIAFGLASGLRALLFPS
jgi:hypothetical protein